MALKSILLRGDAKLEAAAVSDPAHILPGARGPHIVKIQQALIEVDGADIEPDGVYGSATAAAVAAFKRRQRPPILNFAGKIDDIVGIKTLAALDGMLPKEGGLELNFKQDAGTFVDVVVNCFGATADRRGDADEALPPSLLPTFYEPVPGPDPFKRKLLRNKKNNNLLLRIQQNTSEFGVLGQATLFRVLLDIRQMLVGKDPSNGNALQPGKICTYGTSSGGRNAIDFVGFLARERLRTHFVAAIDASFNQDDTADRPTSTDEPVEPIPTLSLLTAAGFSRPFVALVPNRHNFFQRQGNHAKHVVNPFASEFLKLRYTSNMGGGLEEIHGHVEGFVPHLMVVKGTGLTDDQLHDQFDADGRLEAQKMIVTELLK